MPGQAAATRAPFLVTVEARVCGCQQPPKELGRAVTLKRAVAIVSGYWNVYLGFFGDQQVWLTWLVVDTRSGEVMWRNGRPPSKESEPHGLIEQQD